MNRSKTSVCHWITKTRKRSKIKSSYLEEVVLLAKLQEEVRKVGLSKTRSKFKKRYDFVFCQKHTKFEQLRKRVSKIRIQ